MKKTLLLFSLLQLSCQLANAQDEKIQALLVYKFIENVGWPIEKQGLVIGVIGDTKVKDELVKAIQARQKTNMEVRMINAADAPECDVVYLPEEHNSVCKTVIETTYGKSSLIVTEDVAMIKKGAGIGLIKENNKIGCSVNKPSLDRRNIKVTKQILLMSKEI